MEIKPGSFVRVIKDFESEINGDLNLIEDDIVKVKSIVNEEWLEGLFGDAVGIFPASHCVKLKLIPSSDPFGVAIYSHEAHLHDELSFEAGDQIFFISKVNPEWYTGTCGGRTGMFPLSYVSIVTDLPSAPSRPVPPSYSIPHPRKETNHPERPKSLDAATIANLRTKSLSKRNSVHPQATDETNRSPQRPPVLEHPQALEQSPGVEPPNFPPPLPPAFSFTDSKSNIEKFELEANKTSPPKRPPSMSQPPSANRNSYSEHSPSRPLPLKPDALLGLKTETLGTSEPLPETKSLEEGSEGSKIPRRPPPLDTETVSVLRERTRSQGKRGKDKSPCRPPSTYLEPPSVDISTLPPQEPSEDSPPEEQLPTEVNFTPVAHQGFSDWNVEYEERKTFAEEPGFVEEEVEYANAADIQAVEEEYNTTAAEEAALRKLKKSIAVKERLLVAEQESKMQTEDLLAKQFSGKKIDKESVELLRSLLNAHNEKIAELCNKIDSMKAKARSLKSPAQKPEKLDGIERRDKVVIELIETEESNLAQLKLCIRGFVQTLRSNTEHSMDIDMLFLNIENIVGVAERLLMMLKGQATLMSHEQMIGRCFTHIEEDLHREYTFYLENHAAVMDLIKQYLEDKTNKELLSSCLHKIREETTCWDLQSFLIRPVQRIMKYPLFLRDILNNSPAHWADRPYLISAIEIVDNIVVYANENKRKDELIRRYNHEVADGSLLPKLTLHSLKKKSKRLTTTLTHSLNITTSVVEDSTFGGLSETFATLVIIIKTLIREATNFTDLLKKVQVEMDNLCTNIHNFYDNLETQKNVFLYHGAALKIAQNYTPRFITDLEEGPLGTLSDLLNVFTAPQYFIEKRNSKILDYDNISSQAPDGGIANESLKIARGEFEALNKQLLQDLPILIHEGAEVVKKSSYSVLALFCQYSHACHDEFKRALDKMSLELEEPPDSLHLYHMSRMKSCCVTLLTISSFDKEVTQAIVLGSTIKPVTTKFYDSDACEEEQPATTSYDVNKWLENQPTDLGDLSSDDEIDAEDNIDLLEELFEKPGVIEDVLTGTNCRLLYDFTATSDTMLDVKCGDTVTLLSDCLISDTWAYVNCGRFKGYVPKSYLTLPGTLKNKPAPLPPAKTNPNKSKSIKRRAPPPPKRTVSEIVLPVQRDIVEILPPEPEPVSQPEPASQPEPPKHVASQKSSKIQPKRHAPPPPPMSRRNTAPIMLHKPPTLEQVSNLDVQSDSSGGGQQLLALPEYPVPNNQYQELDGEEPGNQSQSLDQERDILELSSNLDEVDLLRGHLPEPPIYEPFRGRSDPLLSSSDQIYENIPGPDDQLFLPTRTVEHEPSLVPVPIPLRHEVATYSPEPYYEMIGSETSSEYESLPPPPLEVLAPIEVITAHDDVITAPDDVFMSPKEPETAASPDKPNVLPQPGLPVATSDHTTTGRSNPPDNTNESSLPAPPPLPAPRPAPLPSPEPNLASRSSSVSVASQRVNPSPAPHIPRSMSTSVPRTTRSAIPAVPNSPVPNKPPNVREKKVSQGFDDCPMEMTAVRNQQSLTNYEAQYNYRARSPAELSLSARQLVRVLDKSDSDWWLVKAGLRQGYVPALFLKLKS